MIDEVDKNLLNDIHIAGRITEFIFRKTHKIERPETEKVSEWDNQELSTKEEIYDLFKRYPSELLPKEKIDNILAILEKFVLRRQYTKEGMLTGYFTA